MKVPALPVRILAAAAVLVLALVGLVVRENVAREQGTEVRLALAGYDPRSLLQGHYVQFQLSETLPAGAKCPPGSRGFSPNDETWVALKPVGDHHAPAGVAKTREAARKFGGVVARGGLYCAEGATIVPGATAPNTPAIATVTSRLGVDRIHLSQAEAEAVQADLQRLRPDEAPPGYALLSIGRDGRARVKGLIVGQRRVDLGLW